VTRVAVTGATGNVGTSVVEALCADPSVDEIVAIARRPAAFSDPRVRFVRADIARDDLDAAFAGVDAVVHLAWLIQPSRDDAKLRAVNVDGSRRVFEATARAGARALVHASSVGAYSAGPKEHRVSESWPTAGIQSLFYSRHKAEVERMLNAFEADHPGLRVVRLRPGLIFKRGAATGIRRLFGGPFVPSPLVRRGLIPLVPDTPRLVFQAVHSHDVGDAYARAVLGDARGAFNIAAEPVLDPRALAQLLGARRVRVPARVLRRAAEITWHARLQPAPPGWIDLALGVPLMDTSAARHALGWEPRHSASEALVELLDGIRDGAEEPTPPLAAATSGRFRSAELRGGIGAREA